MDQDYFGINLINHKEGASAPSFQVWELSMYYINKKFLKDLFRDFSRSMVGKLCKQNEILQRNKNLSETQKLNLLKDFNRELIYESFRELENNIKFFNEGREYKKYPIYTPSDSN